MEDDEAGRLAYEAELLTAKAMPPERASACGLTECAGKPMCPRCVRWKARDDGMPGDPNERYLRRLLAARVAIPLAYYDDGEAQGQEHGIVIDFMREPVADIDAKLRALNVARAECSRPKPDVLLRLAAEFTRADLGPTGSNYPHVRKLLDYAEAAIESGRA